MSARIVLGAFGGALVMWLLAGLWHEVVARKLYESDTHAHGSHEGIGIIFLAYLVLSSLMVYLYSLLYAAGPPVLSGLKFGALIGLLWVFPHELTMVGAHGKSLPYVLKNAAWHVLEQGVGGVVIGLVLGEKGPIP